MASPDTFDPSRPSLDATESLRESASQTQQLLRKQQQTEANLKALQARERGKHDAERQLSGGHMATPSQMRQASALHYQSLPGPKPGPLTAGLAGSSFLKPRLPSTQGGGQARQAYASAYKREATKQLAAREAEMATRMALRRIPIPGVGTLAGKLAGGAVKEIMDHKEVVLILLLVFAFPFWIIFFLPLAPLFLLIALAWAIRSVVSES